MNFRQCLGVLLTGLLFPPENLRFFSVGKKKGKISSKEDDNMFLYSGQEIDQFKTEVDRRNYLFFGIFVIFRTSNKKKTLFSEKKKKKQSEKKITLDRTDPWA